MERDDRGMPWRDDRWRLVRLPAAATGLLLVERALMGVAGSPVALLRGLGDLGHPWADPVASVLAVIALTAEALVAYVLVVLLLQSLCGLPGSMGRVAARFMSLVTPVALRRLLDVLVGGALLAQVALATTPGTPPGHRWSGPRLAPTASLSLGGAFGPATLSEPAATSHGAEEPPWPVDAMEPAGARPTPRRSAAPLPPWLGGGPSNAAPRDSNDSGDPTVPRHGGEGGGGGAAPRHGDAPGGTAVFRHVVEVGDTLWNIAAGRLPPADRSAANVHRYWRQIYQMNRAVIGADPDLIHPGTRLEVPPFRRPRQ